MDLVRKGFDNFYDRIKIGIFKITHNDPEKAHELFSSFCRMIYSTGLDRLLKTNEQSKIPISNAAGFNKDCEIPLRVLKNLGFDRGVIGSVNGKYWKGNERPRIVRDLENESLINWMGLNSEGAEVVAKKVRQNYEDGLDFPLTISITPTPDISLNGDRRIKDVAKTICAFRYFPFVDRFEYNPSCPNTEISKKDRLGETRDMLWVHRQFAPGKDLYVKVSPDMTDKEIDEFIASTSDLVDGYTLTNTTTQHNYEKGGGSGNLVWNPSFETQKKFYERLKNSNKKIIACGGINSREKVKERKDYGASEIQIFTPLIFRGTKLLKELKK
ncbi:MAG: hypothetical protein PVJ67_00110 [Candidatus Pacearchaeota archaeon]|jgi:dihydroorotate dehydrogenase